MRAATSMRRWVTCLTLSCLFAGEQAFAQSPVRLQPEGVSGRWGLVDAVGYGGVGFLAGVFAAWDSEMGEGVTTIGLSSLAGAAIGAVIGSHASSRIRNGEPVGGTSRFAVSAGAILAGATLGACAAVPLINGEGEGTPLGSDETTLALTMGTGTLLGAWYLRRHTDEFNSARVGITPIRTIDSAYGLRVSMRF